MTHDERIAYLKRIAAIKKQLEPMETFRLQMLVSLLDLLENQCATPESLRAEIEELLSRHEAAPGR